MVTLSQVKEIMASLFRKTAKKQKPPIPVREVMLVFYSNGRIKFDKQEVPISDAGGLAAMFSGKITKSVCGTLQRLSVKDNIPLQEINILMQMTGEQEFVLFLRKAAQVVRNIEIEEFLK